MSSGALIVLVLLVTSCAPEQRRAGTRVDSDLWQQIDGASDLESIEQLIGPPTISSLYSPLWYYIYEERERIWFQDERVKRRAVVVLEFDPASGAVVRRRRYEQTGDSLPKLDFLEKETTAISGVQIGLLQDVFGNIGTIYATQ